MITSVFVLDGLRIHSVPKVASNAIGEAVAKRATTALPTDPGDEYRWMCIRHPLDRLVSCWAYFCHTPERSGDQMMKLGYPRGMAFADFVANCRKRRDDNVHTLPQARFTGGHVIDDMARFEDLNAAWERLRQRFDILPLLHRNRSEHADWRGYYDAETRKIAENLYAEDIALYDSLP